MKRNIFGVTGYPTPDFTTERICRTFNLPNSTLALGAFMGAVWELANEDVWRAYGDMTPAEAASMMQGILWEVMTGELEACELVPAPYWDDSTADDADDELPAPEQIWYGELEAVAALLADDLTFIENLRVWVVAGAFLLLTRNVGATIAFVPIAKRFTLAFRQHDLGGIVRVFIDAAEVGRVDTYAASASVGTFDVWLPDDDDDHNLWVTMAEEHNPAVEGTPEIQVIRKRLSAEEVSPTNIRYNPDTDTVQQTYDNGSTWVNQPGQDPRTAPQFQFPPVVADDPRCQAASNMSRFFADLIGTVLDVMSFGLDALGVATSIMPLFVELGPFAILFDLGLGLGSALVGLGIDVITAEFTPEVFDALTCIFFCNIEADGSVTPDELATIESQISDNFNPDVSLIMSACFFLMGNVGMSNTGTVGDAPSDCSDCDCGWCVTWDFTVSDGSADGWTINGQGEYLDGEGYRGTFISSVSQRALYIYLPCSIEQLTFASFEFTKAGGSGSNNVNNFRIYHLPDITAENLDNTFGTDLTKELSGDFGIIDEVDINLNSGDFAALIVVTHVTLRGIGTPPSIGTVC